MHADFAHGPNFIPDLVRRIESGADIVIAQSRLEGEPSRARRLVRRLAPVLLRGVVSVPGVSDVVSGFSIFRLVTLRNAFRNQPAPLLTTEGWAANAELYDRAARYARRVETICRRRAAGPPAAAQPDSIRGMRPWSSGAPADRCGTCRLSPFRPMQPPPASSQEEVADMRLLSLIWALAIQTAAPAAPVVSYPFAVGEKLSYCAKLGMLTLGLRHARGCLDRYGARGRELPLPLPACRARPCFTRWTTCWSPGSAPSDLSSRRFVQDFVENDKTYKRQYEIYPDSGFFREHGRDQTLRPRRRSRSMMPLSSTSCG